MDFNDPGSPIPKKSGDKNKAILIVLVVLAAGGAGAYYFMTQEETSPPAAMEAPAPKPPKPSPPAEAMKPQPPADIEAQNHEVKPSMPVMFSLNPWMPIGISFGTYSRHSSGRKPTTRFTPPTVVCGSRKERIAETRSRPDFPGARSNSR